MRLLDRWSFAVCTLEMAAAYSVCGREGLFVSYTSTWLCQTNTMWFNIVNHPPGTHHDKACQATNEQRMSALWYPLFLLL